MTVQLPSTLGFSLAPSSLEDPAFEPHFGVGFGEPYEEAFPHLQYHTTALQSLIEADHDYPTMDIESGNQGQSIGDDETQNPFRMSAGAFAPSQVISSYTDTSHIRSEVKCPRVCEGNTHDWHMHAAEFPYNANSRAQLANVRNSGQILPDDTTSVSQIWKPSMVTDKTHIPPGSKMNNTQRARHAANQRHAKAGKDSEVRKDSEQAKSPTCSPERSNVESKRMKYREKNRLAAAKCRRRKNVNVQELEELSREMLAENNFAKAEMKKLRNELICLRTTALHHAAHIQGCNCLALHAYNKRKASELASEWSLPGSLSPSYSMDLVALSSTSISSSAESPSQAGGPPIQLARERRSTSAATGCDARHIQAKVDDSGQYELFDFLRD